MRAAATQGDRDSQAKFSDELLEVAAVLKPADRCQALRGRIDHAHAISDVETERTTIARLIDEAAADRTGHWRASALEARCKLLRSSGEFDAEQKCFAQFAALPEVASDKTHYAEAYLSHADTLIYQGRFDQAQSLLNDVRASLETKANRTAWIRTLSAFSRVALAVQDYAAMSEYAQEAYEESRAIGDIEGEVLSLHNLANGLVYTFAVAEARKAYAKTMALYERIGHRVGLCSVAVDYGLFQTELGLLDPALTWYARALQIAAAIDFSFVTCVGNINLAYCERLRGDYARSKGAAMDALAVAQRLGATHLESAALGTLGAAERELGDVASALKHLKRGVDLRRGGGFPSPRLGDNLCALAATQLRGGDPESARTTIEEMLCIYEANPGLPPQPTEWLATAAQVYAANGDTKTAAALRRRARSIMASRTVSIPDRPTRDAFLNLPFNRALRTRY